MAEPLQAAYGIYYKIQQFALFAAFGLSNTLITVVAFHYGRQEKARLRQCVRYGLLYAAGLMLLVTLLFRSCVTHCRTVPERRQPGDPSTLYAFHADLHARLCVMGVTVLIQGILQGFRCVFRRWFWHCCGCWCCRFRLPAVLAGSHGTEQVWWAFPLAECITAVISVPILCGHSEKRPSLQIKPLCRIGGIGKTARFPVAFWKSGGFVLQSHPRSSSKIPGRRF